MEILLSFPVKLEIFIYQLYFISSETQGTVSSKPAVRTFQTQNYQHKSCHMFFVAANCVPSDNKIEEEDLSGECCQMLCGEQRRSVALRLKAYSIPSQ